MHLGYCVCPHSSFVDISTSRLASEIGSNSPGVVSTSLSSKGQITPYYGHIIQGIFTHSSPSMPIAEIPDQNETDYLLRSLPDIRDDPRNGTERLRPVRSESVPTVKNGNKVPEYNLPFPSSWLRKNKTDRSMKLRSLSYSIEYSVFRPMAYMKCIESESDMETHFVEVFEDEGYLLGEGEWPENHISAENFNEMIHTIVHDVENDQDLKPIRISQGSSGSYFIFGKKLESNISDTGCSFLIYKKGVFKPKDEEPYGPLSPKWSKWLHRTFFPCFFGRSCLIPNLGYISEAAACVLDRQLLLFIVPSTDIIHLKSDQFYHSFWLRTRQKVNYKIGSFQCFLHGYVEANVFLKQHPFPQNLENVPDDTFQWCHENDTQFPEFFWSKALICQFQDELEKLVILDYIMRNTDRGTDNWMIKIDWVELDHDGILKRISARVRIGAIDSGLAFPWKHPDEWRSFPFGWLFLPYYIIGRPFSNKTRRHFLPLLTSKYWWEQTTIKLKSCFQKDADFKERMWHKQIAVLKGQAFNVVEILKLQHAGPLELIRRENLLIWDDTMNVPSTVQSGALDNAIQSSIHNESNENHDFERRKTLQYSETTPLLNLNQSTVGFRLQHDIKRSRLHLRRR
ncbi:hypothetical protein METBIDRAFT_10599 [Metschnikowia bicuspidata var. bicuspidata NRRL YB-4993]|uniref:Phosphatidylinositol 4-kinase n=1 Tax=Metschnikowia bicuspidata var. bicuspidata NRRL YB-4993 TaxID=869754 RepID=A0A1A0HKP2_9ASCO|nr:hypothetical protein METBIDRAFT_10599 [Metschnikowia bicuspidata var. bicuspidata NRRL YB-4993]OBA24462.1 hypothetical protein METBIDRAFT_10599 [Metschnikowia bicuspidata var. bicuspidata NRRL YB-4993]